MLTTIVGRDSIPNYIDAFIEEDFIGEKEEDWLNHLEWTWCYTIYYQLSRSGSPMGNHTPKNRWNLKGLGPHQLRPSAAYGARKLPRGSRRSWGRKKEERNTYLFWIEIEKRDRNSGEQLYIPEDSPISGREKKKFTFTNIGAVNVLRKYDQGSNKYISKLAALAR